jgi:hypothetical protein
MCVYERGLGQALKRKRPEGFPFNDSPDKKLGRPPSQQISWVWWYILATAAMKEA